ncbi:MAG: hypothetical protein K5657_03410 [Desulfovibrio sp.]|nr:hypothetical protein [Desulfovibrio sp.]
MQRNLSRSPFLFTALLLCALLFFSGVNAEPLSSSTSQSPEQYGLSNAPVTTPGLHQEPVREGTGRVLIVPGGRRIDPWKVVPEGWVVADDGSLLSEEGVIFRRNGDVELPFGSLPEGYREENGVIVTPEGFRLAKAEKETPGIDPKGESVLPEGSILLPDGTIKSPDGRILTPEGAVLKTPEEAASGPSGTEHPQIAPGKEDVVLAPTTSHETPVSPNVLLPRSSSSAGEVPAGGIQPEPGVQLWSMLPLSDVPGKEDNTPRKKEESGEKQKKPDMKKEKPAKEAQGKDPRKETPKQPPREPKKERPKPEKKQPVKSRIGDELRIPPESVKTGNLDFLEGCWQGTRPEYYSKRTIKECFCFGANGKNGKRRVIDPQGNRRCVGATRARLDTNGVLHVFSQGAVCSDGERWGQAEMTCRGKGQRTPCSWVFKDANGGRQSYEIPFVRVQSCGRKR